MATKDFKLKISEESDLYCPFDPDQEILSEEVIDYFTRVFLNKHRRLHEDYVIRIISDTPVNEARVKAAIQSEFDRQKDDLRFALRRLWVKLFALAALGVAFLALWLFLSSTLETVGVEVVSIMGWVCVWEATSIAVLQRPELHRMLLNIERLTGSEIVFQLAQDPAEADADRE
ncbi:MAG: hypothetical protein IK080_11335 [Clostridia bacterium]|nr:hypothetical protein [Clostridia bacterium]